MAKEGSPAGCARMTAVRSPYYVGVETAMRRWIVPLLVLALSVAVAPPASAQAVAESLAEAFSKAFGTSADPPLPEHLRRQPPPRRVPLPAADATSTSTSHRFLLTGVVVSDRTQMAILVFSVIYNVLAVGLAVTGRMNPLVAAALMPINSLLTLALVTGGMRKAFSALRAKGA